MNPHSIFLAIVFIWLALVTTWLYIQIIWRLMVGLSSLAEKKISKPCLPHFITRVLLCINIFHIYLQPRKLFFPTFDERESVMLAITLLTFFLMFWYYSAKDATYRSLVSKIDRPLVAFYSVASLLYSFLHFHFQREAVGVYPENDRIQNLRLRCVCTHLTQQKVRTYRNSISTAVLGL